MSDNYIEIERETEAIACPVCNGYAEQVDCTPEEEEKYGCGRDGCCSRAFVCRLCGYRVAMSAPAPDMDDF